MFTYKLQAPNGKILELRQKPNVKSGDYGNLARFVFSFTIHCQRIITSASICHSLGIGMIKLQYFLVRRLSKRMQAKCMT